MLSSSTLVAISDTVEATPVTTIVVPSNALSQRQHIYRASSPPPYAGDSFVESYGGDLFHCDNDIQSCCFAWFCMPGATGKIAGFGDGSNNTHLNDENGTCCLIHCCGMIFLPFCWPCWGVHARWLLEERLAFAHEDVPKKRFCEDGLRQTCCGCCATAQALRAVKNFKILRANGVVTTGAPPTIDMQR